MSDLQSNPALALFVGAENSPVGDIAGALGVESVCLDIRRLGEVAEVEWSAEGVTWVHFVPAVDDPTDEFGEAKALFDSAGAASQAGARTGSPVTFIAMLPSQGLLTGRAGIAAELARGAFEALVRAEIGSWSARGDRLVGVGYAGIEGHDLPGQRASESVRERTPMKRLGKVPQLADVIRYLGSDSARYVTGTVIHVDGGWKAYSWIYPARTI